MSSLNSKFLAENRFWLKGSHKEDFYLYLEIEGVQAPESTRRAPLNISLVVDRSGSMQGDKIAYAKKAAQFVCQNLNADDCVSVVQYDDVVDVVSASQPAQDQPGLLKKIETIAARNTTNLSGGMMEGFRQVSTTKAQGFVNRVLLLSDGLANVGVTDANALRQMAQEQFRQTGIGVSTFGVGIDFDELLMTSLAEYGGGNYYFIENPDMIPRIFQKELQGLLTIVAQNVRLEVSLPEGFQCEKVFGFPADIHAQSVRIPFNDLFSKDKKAVLIKCKALRAPENDFSFQVNLSYSNAIGKYQLIEEVVQIPVQVTDAESTLKNGTESMVIDQIALYLANELFNEAITFNESDRIKRAQEKGQYALHIVDLQLLHSPGNTELARLRRALQNFLVQLDSYGTMDVHGQKAMLKTHRQVRYSIEREKGAFEEDF